MPTGHPLAGRRARAGHETSKYATKFRIRTHTSVLYYACKNPFDGEKKLMRKNLKLADRKNLKLADRTSTNNTQLSWDGSSVASHLQSSALPILCTCGSRSSHHRPSNELNIISEGLFPSDMQWVFLLFEHLFLYWNHHIQSYPCIIIWHYTDITIYHKKKKR